MTIVLPARTGDESMLRSGCVSSAADQTTSPVSRLSAWSWPLLSGTESEPARDTEPALPEAVA